MSTQEAFATLLRDHVGPGLRQLGFKGTRGAYAADRNGAYVNLGFQRSAFGDRDLQRFTINVTVAPIDAWHAARTTHPFLPQRPAASAIYRPQLFGLQIWQKRIGHLMPDGTDHWWRFSTSSDLWALSAEVIDTIWDYALPFIEAQLTAPRSSDIDAR